MRNCINVSSIVGVLLAATSVAPATALPRTPSASGVEKVMSLGGGVVLTCREKANGFVNATWWLRNSRSSDVVRATAKTRATDFGTDTWQPWNEQMTYRTGWINPGVTTSIFKLSSTSPASELQTKITVVSRANDSKQSRTIAWSRLTRC